MAFRFQAPKNDEKSGSLVSSGLVSVMAHALMLTIAGLTFRGCEKQAPAEAGGRDFREIGIATRAPPWPPPLGTQPNCGKKSEEFESFLGRQMIAKTVALTAAIEY